MRVIIVFLGGMNAHPPSFVHPSPFFITSNYLKLKESKKLIGTTPLKLEQLEQSSPTLFLWCWILTPFFYVVKIVKMKPHPISMNLNES